MYHILGEFLPVKSLVDEVLEYNVTLFGFFNQEYQKHYETKFELDEEDRITESYFKVLNQCYTKFKAFTIHINDKDMRDFPLELDKCQQDYIRYYKIRHIIESLNQDQREGHKIDLEFKQATLDQYKSPKIVISYEENAILFLTNTNWDQYKQEEKTYKNLFCVGPVTTIGDEWLSRCESLLSVEFRGLTRLNIVGESWLYECKRVINVDFTGLSQLTTVGQSWLYQCESLVSLDFRGLNQLTSVGQSWLYQCKSLLNVHLNNLVNLTTVTDSWLSGCCSLVNIDFRGLNQLTTVGAYWLGYCESLLSVNFSGLSQLTRVGAYWLADCEKLETVNFRGLSRVTTVGNNWLFDCTSLYMVDFTGVDRITTIQRNLLPRCYTRSNANLQALYN